MNKIATHDSATGEKSRNLISVLVIPFSRTQSKTIVQQWNAGCRSFDIRVVKKRDNWYCAHGLWTSKRTAFSILSELNILSRTSDVKCQCCITYEGTTSNKEEFDDFCTRVRILYPNIIFGQCCCKYGEKINGAQVSYIEVQHADKGYEGGTQGFLPLDARSWHTYLPIPWLWDRIYKRPHKFNEYTYTYVDFL